MMDTEIQYWLSDKDLDNIYSGQYWNNEEEEKKKELYILDGNSQKLIKYLKESTTCYKEFESVVEFALRNNFKLQGIGLDLAAGVCWTTALLSQLDSVEKIFAIDISRHRLLKIAPSVLDLFKAHGNKIVRVIGSFYDLKLPDQSVDFCFMSQAFHHADDPYRLLCEIKQVLKPSGVVLIIGETPIYTFDFIKTYIKNLIKIVLPLKRVRKRVVYKIFPKFNDLFYPDNASGDHFYRIGDYSRIFQQAGFQLYINETNVFKNFIAIKQ